MLLDVELRSQARLELRFSPDHEVLVYVYRGSTDSLQVTQLGLYSSGDVLELNAGVSGASMLVERAGPFEGAGPLCKRLTYA
jgi:redox-sensitive bicupin YhaK (pirin superfamily)